MSNIENKDTIRPPAVAGRFYPADKRRLSDTVAELLAGTDPALPSVRVIVAPHAGYPFSGITAAAAFAQLRGQSPRRVVLMGPSHHFAFEGAAIWPEGAFETPLGTMPVDARFVAALNTANDALDVAEIHRPEHALEVELPFLQTVLGEVPIVPILFGARASAWHAQFGERLASLLEDGDIVVPSTDLSHFLSEAEANVIDEHSLHVVLEGKPDKLIDGVQDGTCSLCGASAVVAGMACANALNLKKRELLDYRTSAWASGDTSRVVGYGAISMSM